MLYLYFSTGVIAAVRPHLPAAHGGLGPYRYLFQHRGIIGTMKARLHPHWIGGRTGYVYSVICEGQLLVERSRDPECDAARALLAKGITGNLTMLDGKTGVPRTIISVEKAAQRTCTEGPHGPRFKTVPNAGSSPEEESSGRMRA